MKIHDVLAEREKTHGSFESHASLSQALKRIMHSRDKAWEQLDPYMREALDTIQHKIARILNGNPCEADHWVDISGYATLVADLLKPASKRGNNCNCKVCKESANTITGRDSKFDLTSDDDDIKI